MRSKMYYWNRIHLLIERDAARNARIISKLKRIYRNRFGEEFK